MIEIIQVAILLLIAIRLYLPNKAEKTINQAIPKIKQMLNFDKAKIHTWQKPKSENHKLNEKVLNEISRKN